MKRQKLKHIVMMLFVMATAIGCLTACNKALKESVIVEDITEELSDILDEEITDVKVIERETDKKDKIDTIHCEVQSKKGDVKYIRYYLVEFGYYDGEWELDEVEEEKEENWDKIPLKGVDESAIAQALYGESVLIGGETWSSATEQLSVVEVKEHTTDLEQKRDEIRVLVTFDSLVKKATGEFKITYTFDDEWKVYSVVQSGNFKAETKPEKAHKIEESDLILALNQQEFEYGGNKPESLSGSYYNYTSVYQDVVINENEISEFKMGSNTSEQKGTIQYYSCTFVLTKSYVTFNVNAKVSYQYDGSQGWVMQGVEIFPVLSKVDILGSWSGEYKRAGVGGKIVLDITEMTEDGKVSGIYSYTPDEISRWTQAGSYLVSGRIDKGTLYIELLPGDWVKEDTKPLSDTKIAVNAQLYIDEANIKGTGHEACLFTLVK